MATYLTARIKSSNGNHGHQLKDLLGALTIAKVFNFSYAHTPYGYLDFSRAHVDYPLLKEARKSAGGFDRKIIKSGKRGDQNVGMNGLPFKKATQMFQNIECGDNTLVILDSSQPGQAARIHPCQTIEWYKDGLIERNVFEEITTELNDKFQKEYKDHAYAHGLPTFKRLDQQTSPPDEINIAMHINRGQDFNGRVGKASKGPAWFRSAGYKKFGLGGSCRFMFPLSYYKNIVSQVESSLKGRKYKIRIYTERMGSRSIIKAFKGQENIILCIGDNRGTKNNAQCHNIFTQFVMSDLFITCNSSFSSAAAYFRGHKPTIYHPHTQLYDLPEDRYFATDIDGNFDSSRLSL